MQAGNPVGMISHTPSLTPAASSRTRRKRSCSITDLFAGTDGCWAEEYYRNKRTQGVDHHATLRCLVQRRIKIPHRMWPNHRRHDEAFLQRTVRGTEPAPHEQRHLFNVDRMGYQHTASPRQPALKRINGVQFVRRLNRKSPCKAIKMKGFSFHHSGYRDMAGDQTARLTPS